MTDDERHQTEAALVRAAETIANAVRYLGPSEVRDVLRPMSIRMDLDGEIYGLLRELVEEHEMDLDDAMERIIQTARVQAQDLREEGLA